MSNTASRSRLQTASPATSKPRAWIPALAFVVALLAIGATGFLLFKHHALEVERDAQDSLAGVAKLKVEQIVRWLGARHNDVEAVSRDKLLVDEVERWFRQGAPQGAMAQKLLVNLESLRSGYHYASIVLLDEKARPRLRAGGELQSDSHDTNVALQAMRKNEVARPDIHWSDKQKPEMDLVAPLAVPGTPGPRVIGAVIFRIDPNVFFFPYIQSWPTRSPSAETFLVRREGNEVLFLNELRHRKGTALKLRLPIDDPLLPAAMALREEAKVAQGLDYRGIPVVAAARAIPGTDWILLAKMDRAEVEAPIRRLAVTASGLAALFMLLSGGMAALWWRKENARYLGALAEEKLQRLALEQQFDYATKYARDIVVLLDEAGRILDCNDAAIAAYGYTREELLRLDLYAVRTPAAGASAQADLERAARGAGITYETAHRRKDGSSFPVEASIRLIEIDGRRLFHVVNRDISERKRVERDLLQRTDELSLHNQILRQISMNVALPEVLDKLAIGVDRLHPGMLTSILLLDNDGKHLRHGAAPGLPDFYNQAIDGLEIGDGVGSCGTAAYRAERVVVEDVQQHPYWVPFRDLARRAGVQSCWSQPIKDRKNAVLGTFAIYHHEPTFPSDAEIRLIENYAGVAAIAIGNSRAEATLRAAEEQYRGLVEQSIAGTYIVQDGKFVYVNPRYAEIFGYGLAGELIGRDVLSVVAEQDRATMTENISRRIDGEIESIKYEFVGLRKDGSLIDIGVHGTRATHRGRPAVIGMIQDISEKKRAEDEIKTYVAQLETAFMSTVEVATNLGEMRDPYTAGHQRRVAGVAVAIGAELGFDVRQLEGLRVAGYLHDIGKIAIPAEILSKPGKLSEIEFELVRGHAQSSYDVLKDVEFPWPVAQVALQHHERMDGSGYPQGLKGEAILLEARIMAVADVVEAMSSHRPYRPGLGIDKALAEIERGRGTAYDADVADACLRLFRKKDYRLHV